MESLNTLTIDEPKFKEFEAFFPTCFSASWPSDIPQMASQTKPPPHVPPPGNTHLKFNIAPEKLPSQKENSLPTIHFQGLC